MHLHSLKRNMTETHPFSGNLLALVPSVLTAPGRRRLLLLADWALLFEKTGIRLAVFSPDPEEILSEQRRWLHLDFLLLSDTDLHLARQLGCLQTRQVFGSARTLCVPGLFLCDLQGHPLLIRRQIRPEILLQVFEKALRHHSAQLQNKARELVDNPFLCC